jgi:hypothetical protein
MIRSICNLARCSWASAVAGIVLLPSILAAEETPIIRAGQPNAVIVLPDGANDAVKAAAEALRKIFKESFGADIPVVMEFKEYVIHNTDKLEAYVIHILCPARFGGESDGNRIHILCSRVPKDAGGKELDHSELWYAEFEMPTT